ncbi:MAG: rhodanese-like domain-containing protein [Desulfosarcina sp.]|nr:rhodanese-like domain-containing protein [Desulfobacterales bacterium]
MKKNICTFLRHPWKSILICVAGFLAIVSCSDSLDADISLADRVKQQKIDELYEGYKGEFPGVTDFSAQQTLQLKKRIKIFFVDIRTPEEQAVSMLPGAVTEKNFLKNSSAYQNYIVIAYCTIGLRSGKLAQKLKKKGISIFNLRGGILAWLHAGGIVHKDGKPVNRVHVYGKKWDLAPSAMESVW